MSRTVPPSELHQLSRLAVQQKPCTRRTHIHFALVRLLERLHDLSRFSAKAKSVWIKLLRYQCSAAHPQDISLTVGARSIHGFAPCGQKLHALTGVAEWRDKDAAVFWLCGLDPVQESSFRKHLRPFIGQLTARWVRHGHHGRIPTGRGYT